MRIAYFSDVPLPSRRAGSIHVMRMCEAFTRNGHQVTLHVPKRRQELDPDELFSFYGIDGGFRILGHRRSPKLGTGRLGDHLPGLVAKLQRADLVYARCHSRVVCDAARKSRIPTVFELHLLYPGNSLIRSILSSRNLRRVVLISEGLRRGFLKLHDFPEERTVVAHDGATPANGVTAKRIGDPSKFRIAYAGHLYPGRIDTIAGLAPRCPWADFHVFGGTEGHIQHWKRTLDGVDNIRFHGFVPPAAVASYLAGWDLLLAPYRREVYGAGGPDWNVVDWMSPLKIFEYMASGTPFVTSALPVLQEVLVDRETAYLCEPEDLDSWQRTLEEIRDQPDEALRIANRAREVFLKRYTWQARAAAVLDGVAQP
jgi:glycosyltransferase involved in cell wall biosynthesis